MGAFPAAGAVYVVDYGDMVIEHDYTTDGKLTYTITSAPHAGYSYTADITVTRIRDDIFTVKFEDQQARLVLVEDFGQHTITTFMAMQDGSFVQLQGSFTAR